MIAGVREWLRPIITVLAYSGLRFGELRNLRWKDVDLQHGLLHVRVREDWRPKGRRSRSVPMHRLVRQSIPARHSGEYVFAGPEGGRLKESYCLKCLTDDREELGIQEGTLHTFRHFFISECAARGVPMATCMSWVGHRDSEVAWRYYHLSETSSREAMKRLEGAQ